MWVLENVKLYLFLLFSKRVVKRSMCSGQMNIFMSNCLTCCICSLKWRVVVVCLIYFFSYVLVPSLCWGRCEWKWLLRSVCRVTYNEGLFEPKKKYEIVCSPNILMFLVLFFLNQGVSSFTLVCFVRTFVCVRGAILLLSLSLVHSPAVRAGHSSFNLYFSCSCWEKKN